MPTAGWRDIVASALDWDQAHITLDGALKGLSKEDRGRQPAGYPHSVWQLLEHIRIAQHDLLDFCRNSSYSHDMKWPDDYWPSDPAPPNDAAWNTSLKTLRSDREEFAEFATNGEVDLAEKIPHGTGQTYLRTILVAVDHSAYHLGQIVYVRRLLGTWEAT
jgi:uncharacterized damage-inducible protein DinB